jgi:hypothetical protein
MLRLRTIGVTVVTVAFLGTLVSCGTTSAGDDDTTTPQQDASVVDPNQLEGGVDQNPTNPTCHEQTFVPERIGDPDIIVLMDMSGSMSESSKYTQTATAVTSVITDLEAQGSPIWWGLLFFPTDGDCGVEATTLVEPAANNAATITTAINSKSPGGNTPAHKAVQAANEYYNTLNDDRGHYLLIATDGQPNCDPSQPLVPAKCDPANPVACAANEICQAIPFFGGFCVPADGGIAVDAITTAAATGVKTYVVGIDIDGSNSTLDMMAEAGGTARPGSPKYYPVSDQASMVSTLQNITSQIISCTFALDQVTADMDYVSVSVSGSGISRDETHANGWDIDTNAKTLTFYGDACTALQVSPDTVSVIYGCPPPG